MTDCDKNKTPTRNSIILYKPPPLCYNKHQQENANRNRRLTVSTVKSEPIQNGKELEFAIFCVENIAIKLGVGAERVYDALTESGLLNNYIVPGYETLHTQDKSYIIDDILSVMSEKGVEL